MFWENLGLTHHDIALLIGCPIGGIVGSMAQAIVKSIDLDGPPTKEYGMRMASKELQVLRGMWLYLRLTLGGILGLVLGLYFVGAIQPTSGTEAKIIALSIVAGYAAPKVWEAQEKIIDAKLKQAVAAQINNAPRDRNSADV